MGKQTRDTLKSYFQTGDVPTEGQYADLIDSHLILDETNTGILDIAGNITSSANISASGTIKGLNYQIGDRNFANISATDSAGIELGNGGTGNLLLTNLTASANISSSGNLIINNITASGTISASGTIFTNKIESPTTLLLGDPDGNVNGARISIDQSNNTVSVFSADLVVGQTGGAEKNLNVTRHITASGNISASGFIQTPRINGANNSLYIADSINLAGTSNLHITASGNISASGKLIATTLNTGQGDNELYDMDQNVKTTSTPTFSSITIPNIGFSQIREGGNEFTVAHSDGAVNVGSIYGGVIIITGIPATDSGKQLKNFLVAAARCQVYMVVVASSDRNILITPNLITDGSFSLNIATGAEGFVGGSIRINFQMLGV